MNTTARHLTAANVVYDRADFADPHLPGPTALQVDRMGRVRGHLAAWNTPHIGHRQRILPPHSATNYSYFHQGVIETSDGDLPVGTLTLGTGHAGPNDPSHSAQQAALAAAAHYDNTGTGVAVVRAGEDAHGIWVSGRLLPGTDENRREELRRSGISGDWREIELPDGRRNLELVAALAVNVPGFPIPRTETLVASGADHPTALVAAGIVMPSKGPVTRAEVEEITMAAALRAQEVIQQRDEIRASAHAELQSIIEYQNGIEAKALIASAEAEVAAARRADIEREFLSLLAAGVPKTDDQKAAPLRRYWTKGKGLARWATSTHPYTTLVSNLESEIKGEMTSEQIKGLAANYYHAVFGKWPGKHGGGKGGKLAAAGELVAAAEDAYVRAQAAPLEPEPRSDGMIALLPTQGEQLAVPGGEPGSELHVTLVYFPDVAHLNAEDIQRTVRAAAGDSDRLDGKLFGRADFNVDPSSEREPCAVWLVEAGGLSGFRQKLLDGLGDRAPKSDFDSWVPHMTAGYGMSAADLPTGQQVTFDRVRISLAGQHTDIPLGVVMANLLGEVTASAASRVFSEAMYKRDGNGRFTFKDKSAPVSKMSAEQSALRKELKESRGDKGKEDEIKGKIRAVGDARLDSLRSKSPADRKAEVDAESDPDRRAELVSDVRKLQREEGGSGKSSSSGNSKSSTEWTAGQQLRESMSDGATTRDALIEMDDDQLRELARDKSSTEAIRKAVSNEQSRRRTRRS